MRVFLLLFFNSSALQRSYIMNQKKKTMIIKGDLSGIQEFIFNIPSKGAARMLKARSFFVQVIVELAVEKIKLFCQNKDFEVINKSGGSFFIKC